jgi:hypothetical protein
MWQLILPTLWQKKKENETFFLSYGQERYPLRKNSSEGRKNNPQKKIRVESEQGLIIIIRTGEYRLQEDK